MSHRARDSGFTMIELLVVIVIIGILAAIAIPVFLNQRKKGVDASLKSDLKNAATAVETWNTDNPSTVIADASVTAPNPGTGALAGFKPSPGNTIKLKGSTTVGVYTLCAFNAGASVATDGTANKNLVYDSSLGGLQSSPGAAAC